MNPEDDIVIARQYTMSIIYYPGDIMLLYQGKTPFSSFRQKKLLSSIQKKVPGITNIDANYLYFIQTEPLSSEENKRLIQIVDPTSFEWTPDKTAILVFVTPRFGTISPWSSKATDILQVCGLTKVTRIERGIIYRLYFEKENHDSDEMKKILPLLHDRMTETCSQDRKTLMQLFKERDALKSELVPLRNETMETLTETNKRLGLALSEKEIVYLQQSYSILQREPSIAELMMFAQINSEHCRHKIFNATWTLNGEPKEHSLFTMIKNTYVQMKEGVLSAYKDNGAIIKGPKINYFFSDAVQHRYDYQKEEVHIVIKVETHNHPTAIAPFEGAATGAGGEIRDEGATGIGAKPKAGLVGFSVSNLHIPKLPQPWEKAIKYPDHIATSLDIMLQGPIGAAAFNNEFGRPGICGYFRTFEWLENCDNKNINVRGYHKPIMIAGGLGQIRSTATEKRNLPVGTKLVVLGGPAMLIGLGGGAASSVFSGGSHQELDFASVQRSNPEMQRRCQEVINACFSLGEENPIISIHDVGAGGLSNALSELVHDSNKGAVFQLRAIRVADSGLSGMEIWCNEAQERYVLGINPEEVALFQKIAERERCPFAVVGEVNESMVIELWDEKFEESPVNLPLQVLFGEASKLEKNIHNKDTPIGKALSTYLPLNELIQRVLQLPTVADKRFLITIGDRTVTGLVTRDQMVGPWQVPVSDVGVTSSSYEGYTGEAMAMGERTPLSLLNARASARMAIAEAITNIIAADIRQLSDIKLSANWMAAVKFGHEESKLYDAVHEVGMKLCPALGICIPVGKDSLSMQMRWQEEDMTYNVASPLSLIISAFAPVEDIRKTSTPELNSEEDTELLLIDLGGGQNRLGGSSLAQVTNQLGDKSSSPPPDLDDPQLLKQFFNAVQALRDKNLLLAYHDRSDGGLLTTIAEMMFASKKGITLEIGKLDEDYVRTLFNEELGAVIQYPTNQKKTVFNILSEQGLMNNSHIIGKINTSDNLIINSNDKTLYSEPRVFLHRIWSETSFHLQSLRDNPVSAQQEYDSLLDEKNPGLHATLTFPLPKTPSVIVGAKPKVAILREQGVNGHMEMAAAFNRAGFEAIDVHMTDIISGEVKLKSFQGLAACGGFSYGDVLGAGRGWANSILFNDRAREEFDHFFNMPSVFVLGVCNGCQMLSNLKPLIPGAQAWPNFVRNTSEQFEARLSLVKIQPSRSILFRGMENSILPIAVSHGEGRVDFQEPEHLDQVLNNNLVAMQFVNNYGEITETYPSNPNGSLQGIAALTNEDGRFTIMMPHAERVFRTVQFSWRPKEWQEENSPWFQLFVNARNWLM